MARKKEDLICPRCGEFIGNAEGLDCCPVCGASLISKDGSNT